MKESEAQLTRCWKWSDLVGELGAATWTGGTTSIGT